jgi:hypothetical protein
MCLRARGEEGEGFEGFESFEGWFPKKLTFHACEASNGA